MLQKGSVPIFKSEDYCPVCHFPKREKVCEVCVEAARSKRRATKESRAQELRLVERLGGWRAYEEYLAENFRPSDVTKPALEAVLEWDHETQNIYLWSSGSGTGKSHLAVAGARQHLVHDVAGQVFKPNELFGKIKATYDEEAKESDRDVISYVVRLPILVVDDLGTQKDTEWNVACLYDLIDGRYSHRPGGLIVTANLSLEQAGRRWGARIASRLEQMCGRLIFNLSAERDHRRTT